MFDAGLAKLRRSVARFALVMLVLASCRPHSVDAASLAKAPLVPHPRIFLPALRPALERRRAEPSGRALLAFCTEHADAEVAWPDQGGDNDRHRIAAGYQGGDYLTAVASFGLCWQLTHDRAFANEGVAILLHMSEPDGPHAPRPLADDGYGIRFYGVGLALGFDWLYDALTPVERKRVYTALERWLSAYEEKGFGHEHPAGNYFAGYYAAKCFAALATEGDDPKAPAHYRDFIERVHGQMVAPYFSKYLRGGGWPEGWNYGPLATLNLAVPLFAVKTAKGVDLLPGFRFPVEQAEHLMHFTWPTRRTLDDRGAQYAGDNPSRAEPALFSTLAGLLAAWKEPLAPEFHRYARDVRAKVGGEPPAAWKDFLWWDPGAPEADYRGRPLSYRAEGLGTVAMRSSWDEGAVWASFTAGTYNTNSASGEMYFDQGSLVIVRGGEPLLVNTVSALLRRAPGAREDTGEGTRAGELVYEDLFGNHDAKPAAMNRTLFNIFYASASQYGQIAAGPDEAATRLDRFEDAGRYVLMRGTRLEDMYRRPRHGIRPVAEWTRQVLYLRPSTFVIDDWTRTEEGVPDQWLAFHLGGHPAVAKSRIEVPGAGVVTPVLPPGAALKLVDVFDLHKVWRLEIRPPRPGAALRWRTVIDAAPGAPPAQALTVASGQMTGVAVGERVVLSPLGERAEGEIRYLAPAGATAHVVTGLSPGQAFTVAIAKADAGWLVRISAGGPRRASAAGVLTFQADAAGVLARP